jgi:chemotaxis protein MotB
MVAEVVKKLPNRISVSGRTDASPYRGGVGGYSNWELSADRANASRRLLTENGLDAKRIALVQGKAEIEPLIADDPASPRNRRISIVLLHDKPLAGAAAAAGTAAPAKSKAAPAGSLRPPTGVLGEGGPAPTPAR